MSGDKFNKKKVVHIIGGYARAGKTTVVNYLESKGFLKISTSGIVHQVAQNFLRLCGFGTVDTSNKNLFISITVGEQTLNVSMRTFLIAIADSVRSKSPMFYAELAVEEAFNSNCDEIVLESVGGAEGDYIVDLLHGEVEYTLTNIRGRNELKGVDLRELLPDAQTITNNYDEQLYTTIDERFNTFYPEQD